MALLDKLSAVLNRSPADVAKEQIRKLYLRLYPYIVDDFPHKQDVFNALAAVQLELAELKLVVQRHTHVVAAVGAGNTAPMSDILNPVSPAVIPSDAVARSLVIPGGAPQPTGAGISIQDTRLDIDPIAIPPLDPSTLA